MKWHYRFLLKIIFGAGLSLISAQDPFELDSALTNAIPRSISNSIQIADLNNDGYTDIIMSGYDSTRFGTFLDVIQGNSDGTLSQGYEKYYTPSDISYAEYLGGLGNSTIADVDLDGDMDIYINGSDISRLLFNNSSASFSESSWLENLSMTYSNGQWGDANMDGRPDLFLMGLNTNYILNELFINTGSNLQKDPTTIFPSLLTGSSTWGDYDNDGDPDLIIGGRTANPISSVTRLYQNDPIGRLTEVTTADAINGLKAGASNFVDLDADGDLDLITTGWNKIDGKLVTYILENEPLGTFSLASAQIDFAVAHGTIDVIDLNLDGLKDLVIAGADSVTNYAETVHSLSAKVYVKNPVNGNYNFVKHIRGARTARFVDIDHDRIPDIIASGTTEIGNADSTFSNVYLNTHSGVNDSPDPPDALTAFAVSTRAIFTWGSGSDDIDEPAGLSYNIRIGTSPGGNQLMSSSVPYNSSNVGQRLIREFNEIPHGTYYWAVQTVDGSGNISEWSEEDTLFIARLVASTQSLPGVYYSSAGWADYTEDGLLDLALTGVTFSGASITNLFENTDGLLSQDLSQNIAAFFGGHISWVDYTNDGHLDLTMTGFSVIDFVGYYNTSFYKYENGYYIKDTESDFYTIDANNDDTPDYWVNGGVNGHHWGDYDNDGDLDFVQGGRENPYRHYEYGDLYGYPRHLDIFYNENGILRLDTNQVHLVPIHPAIVQWVDIDRDGRLDLVTIGSDSTESLRMRVYTNNSNHILTPSISWDSETFGVTAGAIAFADYNSDGYDDFALTGLNSSQELITYIVKNSVSQFTVEEVLQGVYYGKPAWGDYDADGDLDLLVSGQTNITYDYYGEVALGSDPVTTIYYQKEDGSFSIDQTLVIDSVGVSFTQWGDYDADGDLDLFLSGFKANEDVVAQVYDNLEGIQNANKPPNAPYLLDDSNINNDRVTLTWSAPVDPDNSGGGSTEELGLRYQIQIGSEDEDNEHAISTGHYGVGEIGTFNRTEKRLQNIPEGSYSWRVRAIDHGYASSNWSNMDYFYIDVTAPTVDTIRANYVTDDQIILVVKFKEDFYLDLNIDPTVLATHPYYPDLGESGSDDDSLVVEKQSFNGDEWTGVLILPDEFSGKAIQIHVYGTQDDRQNKMVPTTIFKTPESIISQFGGTAISEDGNVSILLPQNAVTGDISISITGQDVPPDTSSFIYEVDRGITYLISDLYDIKPFDQSLNKPGILRIAFPDSICLITEALNQYFNLELENEDACIAINGDWIAMPDSGMVPFIGMVDTSISGVLPILKLGGSQISVSGNPYMQVQIDTFGTYGAFVSMDSTLLSDSLNIESIVCQPRIFSPGGNGSVFEFTQTNIFYSLEESEDVTARIFNLSGRLKQTIKPEVRGNIGRQVMNWDGKDSKGNVVPSGLYIVTLEKSDTILRTTVGVLNR
jgi:hypothetical protein